MSSRRPKKGTNSPQQKTITQNMGQLKLSAYGMILAIAAGSAAFQSKAFKSMCTPPSDWSSAMPFALHIFLFTELVVLVLLWISATDSELQLWLDWLEIPFVKSHVRVAMYGLAVVLGLFFVVVYNIVLITGFFTLYLLFNYWTQWLANDHFRRAFAKTQQLHLGEHRKKVLLALEEYWLEKPLLGRIATMMFFSSVAFSFALAGAVQPAPTRSRFQLVAYGILTLTILIGELIVTHWRLHRDRRVEHALEASA